MATTPAPTPASPSIFSKISGYLVAHERLLIVALCLITGGWLVSKGLDIYQTYEQGKLNGAEQQLQQTQQQAASALQAANDAKNQAIITAQQSAADQAASSAIIRSLAAQNASLNQQIAQRGKQTQQQQQTDLNASLPDLGKRFTTLVPSVNPQDIHVASDEKSVSLGQDTAQKTVAQLELIPELQADNTDLQTQVTNSASELAASQKALDSTSRYADAEAKYADSQEKYSTLLTTELGQSDKVCNDKIAVVQAKSKKSFLNGFKWGAITGFIGGLFLGHGI